jgi:hypothetical protein
MGGRMGIIHDYEIPNLVEDNLITISLSRRMGMGKEKKLPFSTVTRLTTISPTQPNSL